MRSPMKLIFLIIELTARSYDWISYIYCNFELELLLLKMLKFGHFGANAPNEF